jgi:sec-independent protein translocase protein TatA
MFGGGLDSPIHIVLLLLVVLLVFGAKRLPEIGRSLGSGIREFRHSVSGESLPPGPQGTHAGSAGAAGAAVDAEGHSQSTGSAPEDIQRRAA